LTIIKSVQALMLLLGLPFFEAVQHFYGSECAGQGGNSGA
jgi:hypothetical protein